MDVVLPAPKHNHLMLGLLPTQECRDGWRNPERIRRTRESGAERIEIPGWLSIRLSGWCFPVVLPWPNGPFSVTLSMSRTRAGSCQSRVAARTAALTCGDLQIRTWYNSRDNRKTNVVGPVIPFPRILRTRAGTIRKTVLHATCPGAGQPAPTTRKADRATRTSPDRGTGQWSVCAGGRFRQARHAWRPDLNGPFYLRLPVALIPMAARMTSPVVRSR